VTAHASATGFVCAAAFALLGGCASPPSPAPTAPVQDVVQRLTAADFGLAHALPHGPVVKIGDEARAAAVAPRVLEIATLRGQRLAGGKTTNAIELPDAARPLPDEAFDLGVQLIPFDDEVTPDVFDFFATETFHQSIPSTWALVREPGGAHARLEVTPATERSDVRLNLELRALLPQPSTLDSTAFVVPPDASIVLGYGVAVEVAARAIPTIRFRATMACDGGAETALLDDTIAPEAGAPGWRSVTRPLPAARDCRLRLETTSPDGSEVRAAAWAEPLVFGPAGPRVHPVAENVVLVSLDTLRADHLSGYGYARPTSPAIDAQLIARGTAFDDVSTTFPRTDVSHLSLFTSLFPDAQPSPGRVRRDASATLLTESLRDAGLVTAAFTEDALIAGAFGFWYGFDRFVERAYTERERGTVTFADGLDFVRANAERRFFLFLHTYKTHKPYVTPEQYAGSAAASDWDRLPFDKRIPPAQRPQVDAYDRTVREADDLMAKLLAELARLGIAERTLVVVLSDHGEAFGEHRALEHGYAAHQEQLRIPLVFRGPGVPAGVRVTSPASIVDVAPTVLELAGATPLPHAQGISLAPAFAGHDLPRTRPLFFSWLGKGARGVRHGQWKYMRSEHGHELFDLQADPLELFPRGRGRPPRPIEAVLLAEHRAASEQLRALFNAGAATGAGDVIDQRMQDSLKALGYVE